jgi:hypothetical protein
MSYVEYQAVTFGGWAASMLPLWIALGGIALGFVTRGLFRK